MSSLRTLLRQRLEWIEDRLMQNAEKNGYGYISPSTARLYSYLSDEPTPMPQLAKRLKISRQAVHQLVSEGIQSGFLELCDSPSDKRVKMVKFSAQGSQMSAVARAEIDQAEQQLIQSIGAENVEQLRRILQMPWPQDAPLD